MLYTGDCTVYTGDCTVYTGDCTVYTGDCTVYTGDCTVYRVKKYAINIFTKFSMFKVPNIFDKTFQGLFRFSGRKILNFSANTTKKSIFFSSLKFICLCIR